MNDAIEAAERAAREVAKIDVRLEPERLCAGLLVGMRVGEVFALLDARSRAVCRAGGEFRLANRMPPEQAAMNRSTARVLWLAAVRDVTYTLPHHFRWTRGQARDLFQADPGLWQKEGQAGRLPVTRNGRWWT